MTRCWIRNPGAAGAAGPFTLADLRGLRAAGLLTPATLVSTASYEGFRPSASWPELIRALDKPEATTIEGEKHLRTSGTLYAAPEEPEAPAARPRESTLRTGAATFATVNRDDAAGKVSALDHLALNRAGEREVPVEAPPAHREPWVRNLIRLLPGLIIGGWLLRYGLSGMRDNPYVRVPFVATGGLVISASVWFVLIIAPARRGE